MIYITGDCHGDYVRFNTASFPEQKTMTKNDYVIVCGDFGLWHKNNTEKWWHKWLNEKPFTTLFVGGNHENYDRLYSDEFEIVDFCGGKAQKISDSIYYLMRGEIYTIDNKKIFTFGGASSHDINDGILDINDFESEAEFDKTYYEWVRMGKMFRINHLSWWKEELPTQHEMDFGLEKLNSHQNKVDFIISHCAPQHVANVFSNGCYKSDILTNYFDKISKTTDFKYWFFGHYHDNKNFYLDDKKYSLLYEQIIRIS